MRFPITRLSAIFFLGVFLTFSLLAAGCANNASTSAEGPKVSSKGQEVFLNQCMTCHMGAGDPPGPNDVILHSAKLASEDAFSKYVRQPDNGMMPAFSKEPLSDADLKELYAYVKQGAQ